MVLVSTYEPEHPGASKWAPKVAPVGPKPWGPPGLPEVIFSWKMQRLGAQTSRSKRGLQVPFEDQFAGSVLRWFLGGHLKPFGIISGSLGGGASHWLSNFRRAQQRFYSVSGTIKAAVDQWNSFRSIRQVHCPGCVQGGHLGELIGRFAVTWLRAVAGARNAFEGSGAAGNWGEGAF